MYRTTTGFYATNTKVYFGYLTLKMNGAFIIVYAALFLMGENFYFD